MLHVSISSCVNRGRRTTKYNPEKEANVIIPKWSGLQTETGFVLLEATESVNWGYNPISLAPDKNARHENDGPNCRT